MVTFKYYNLLFWYMAELPEQIKVGKNTKGRLLKIQEDEGHSSMDSAVRSVLDKLEKLEIETELLQKKLDDYEKNETEK